MKTKQITQKPLSEAGFSLVELSIVLVILGLLVAGITAGSALIKNAELRAITAEMNRYNTNINAFRTSFDYFPGDMPNADEFWDPNTACSGGGAATMVGDSNGRIEYDNSNGVSESYMAWCHLALANLASGPFDGVPVSADAPVANVEVPGSRVDGGLYMVGFAAHGLSNSNVLVLGGATEVTMDATLELSGVLTPREARNIDAKIDDANPSSGIVRGFDGVDVAVGDCLDDQSDTDLTNDIYNVLDDGTGTSEIRACGVAYRIN